jgi:hypothetical protein
VQQPGRDSEGKDCLIKNNMLGDDDVVGGEIETLIALVIDGVSEEYTTSGPGGGGTVCEQLMQRGWDSKHSQKCASAYMRVRHCKERHTSRRR